jgi:hypothetical protein
MGNNGKHGKQWEAIIAYVAESPGTKAWDLLQLRNVSALLQQCDVDRELLRECGMRKSPQYAFNCDVIHNLGKYKEVSCYSFFHFIHSNLTSP